MEVSKSASPASANARSPALALPHPLDEFAADVLAPPCRFRLILDIVYITVIPSAMLKERGSLLPQSGTRQGGVAE